MDYDPKDVRELWEFFGYKTLAPGRGVKGRHGWQPDFPDINMGSLFVLCVPQLYDGSRDIRICIGYSTSNTAAIEAFAYKYRSKKKQWLVLASARGDSPVEALFKALLNFSRDQTQFIKALH